MTATATNIVSVPELLRRIQCKDRQAREGHWSLWCQHCEKYSTLWPETEELHCKECDGLLVVRLLPMH